MQKRMQRTTRPRTKGLRAHGAVGRRAASRRLAVVGAVLLLLGVRSVARSTAGPGPGESP